MAPTFSEAEREVWDILDAGPLNRFTCEGLLVHNCHSGNYLRFQEDWEQVYAEGPGDLDDGREKAKPEPTERDKKAAVCPKCASIFPASQDVCSHCGYTRMRHNGVVVLPGDLQEIAKRERVAQADRQKFYSELVHVAESRGYKPGWAFWKFKEKFGTEPRGLRTVPETVSFDTLKWIQSQQIRYAKSQQRRTA